MTAAAAVASLVFPKVRAHVTSLDLTSSLDAVGALGKLSLRIELRQSRE
jgi:hypothetical protein